jgi:hypothetical protein
LSQGVLSWQKGAFSALFRQDRASKKGKTKTSFWVYDYDLPKSCCPLPLKFREIVQDYFVSKGYEISLCLNGFGDIIIEIDWSMDIKKEW